MPYDPVSSRADAEVLARGRQPFTFGEVIREGQNQRQREANTSVYQSPVRPSAATGHGAKTKSSTLRDLGMTPNSTRLDSSLRELSLEKDASAREEAATKRKLQAKPARGVPPEQTVKGTLPQHQRLLDEAGPSDPGRF